MLIKGLQPGDCRRSYIEERVLIHSALFFCMKMASLSQLLHFCHREIFRLFYFIPSEDFIFIFHTGIFIQKETSFSQKKSVLLEIVNASAF